MPEPTTENSAEVAEAPDLEDVVTEDQAPVDNLFSEKEQRLLTETLYSSWAGPGEDRLFLASSNVGIFDQVKKPPVVPDVFLSLDVQVAQDWMKKEHRSYFLWEFGKCPELVLEIVSNREGEEEGEKKRRYARMRVLYYVIHDPLRQIASELLTIYRLEGSRYVRQNEARFPDMGLGLTLWDGVFEGKRATWLRWVDERGVLIPTGRERADQERERADKERERADKERERADQLADLLRRSGIDPDQA